MLHNRERGILSARIVTLYVMCPPAHTFTLGELERKIFKNKDSLEAMRHQIIMSILNQKRKVQAWSSRIIFPIPV